ncbi:MAG: ABC transporter ATP-binding protein [Myxococcota bacterium]
MDTVLELQGVQKRYGKVEALTSLDLNVRPGEIYGFLGKNGAGKSTAIRIIMGITKRTQGEVRLFGDPATPKNHVRLRQRIGYVAQEQTFYHWMTPAMLGRFVRGFYPTWNDDAFRRLIDRLGLPRDRRVGGFSGGMKVKLALALALAHQPKLLVLDEPTAGLDPVARREFLELISDESENSGATTFFSTHLIDEIDVAAHRVGIVDGGKTLYEGPVEALRMRYRRLSPETPEVQHQPPPPATDPSAFRVVKERRRHEIPIYLVEASDPARFAELEGYGWRVELLPLEELFIELVRGPT